jgi:hypothetical protein
MPSSYFVIEPLRDETHVRIQDRPPALRRGYELLKGVPRLDGWPTDLTLRFSPHRPEGLLLTDALENAFGWLLASGALRTLLEAFEVVPAEYLPVVIENHKGRIASTDYWIVNLLALTPAVDRERSVYAVRASDPALIRRFDRLVLTAEVEKGGAPLLRLRERPRVLLARADLVAAAEAEGLTGMEFVPVDTYSTLLKHTRD